MSGCELIFHWVDCYQMLWLMGVIVQPVSGFSPLFALGGKKDLPISICRYLFVYVNHPLRSQSLYYQYCYIEELDELA